MNFNAGDSIGEYKIIRALGAGQFGQVYLVCWQTRRGEREGALKLLNTPNLKDILEEVATWARVRPKDCRRR